MRTQTLPTGMKAGNCRNTIDKLGRLHTTLLDHGVSYRVQNS